MRSWVAIAVVGLATGCVVRGDKDGEPEDTTGSVDISWQMGPSGCEASGITEVEVSIGGVGGTYPCEDEAATLLVPGGTYDLTLLGLDAGGEPRFGGESAGVSVHGGSTTTVPTIVLGALPATLEVSWRFENGDLCANNGVEDVEAFLFDDQDVVQATLAAPCNEGSLLLEDIDAGTYTLLLNGNDAAGLEQFSGTAEIILDRGQTSDVTISLGLN